MSRPRIRSAISFNGPGRTKQSFRDECDINKILAKYKKTGVINHVKTHGDYIDAPSGLDFHEAQNLVLEAEQVFSELPATVRDEFANDPQRFLTFVENPENIERMRELGLATTPEAEPGPIDVNVIEPKTETE